MASGYGNTSDSLDVTVKAVPEHLLEYAVSNFVQTLKEAKNAKKFSAEIHIAEGQLPKFVLLLENQLGKYNCVFCFDIDLHLLITMFPCNFIYNFIYTQST